MHDEILDVSDVAAMLRCDEKTVEMKTRDGDLPGLKFGRSWVYPRTALMARLSELAAMECAQRRAPRVQAPTSAARVERRRRGRVPPALTPCPD
ncbi:MAG: DNA-binding protein [Alcaligenaceae bacterium]|nr:DNA-binding protein [Alcaligenaceae bacterium SAGV5]MPS50400.1 DNA-binding protein [Alcaligenaceae bacterium SAGV3]MPT57939.1 DNA-binding protein [Alcaligenaceae bacterium]